MHFPGPRPQNFNHRPRDLPRAQHEPGLSTKIVYVETDRAYAVATVVL